MRITKAGGRGGSSSGSREQGEVTRVFFIQRQKIYLDFF
jgi:hypothetical protein